MKLLEELRVPTLFGIAQGQVDFCKNHHNIGASGVGIVMALLGH